MSIEKKTLVVLSIYEKLIKNQEIYKKNVIEEFQISDKTFKRYMDEIEEHLLGNGMNLKKVINRNKKSKGTYYVINRNYEFLDKHTSKIMETLNQKDVLAISKILLESRAFCKKETDHIIDSLLNKINKHESKQVYELIGNEQYNFEPLQHNKKDNGLILKIWELSELIRDKEIIKAKYEKMDGSEVERILKPISIIFSEFYFYIIAYSNKLDFKKKCVFRIDRIKEYKKIKYENKLHIEESKRFQDGEFRKKVQFMYSGEQRTIRFQFNGSSIDAVLDKLPTAQITKCDKDNNKYSVKAEVEISRGLIMWLLSQMQFLEVTEPKELREEMKNVISKMSEVYK